MSLADLTFLDVITMIMLTAGGFFVFVGGVGAIRMPDLFTRMHASSLTDTMGSLLILGGLILQSGLDLTSLKLGAITIFLLFTSPVSAYALANAALSGGLKAQGIVEEHDLTEGKDD